MINLTVQERGSSRHYPDSLTVQETRLEGRQMRESHNIDIGQLPVEGVTSVCILLVITIIEVVSMMHERMHGGAYGDCQKWV